MPPPAYGFHRDFPPAPRAVRAFDRDYLLYARSGAVRLGVAGRDWLLPPAFAAWVPADTPIAFDLPYPMRSCSVLFAPSFTRAAGLPLPDRPVVFAMSPLAREMVRHTERWGPDAPWTGPDAAPFFAALLGVLAELTRRPADVWRPTAEDPALRAALAFTEARHDRAVTMADAADAAGLTERTLRRRCTAELGLTWAQCLRRIRMIAATERLVTTDEPVTSVALSVGYGSLSAFNAAFRAFAGTTPTGLRAGLDLA